MIRAYTRILNYPYAPLRLSYDTQVVFHVLYIVLCTVEKTGYMGNLGILT